MENVKQVNCKYPNIKCDLHGKCKECRVRHKGKNSYCQLREDSLRKRMIDKMYRK